MAVRNDVKKSMTIALSGFLLENEIKYTRNSDNSEHLHVGDEIHVVRIAAGPSGRYWYGGGMDGRDTEELWNFL